MARKKKENSKNNPDCRVNTTPAEILSMTVGKVGDETMVILSLRLTPKSYHRTNVALTAEQAVRLSNDLHQLSQTSDLLKAEIGKLAAP